MKLSPIRAVAFDLDNTLYNRDQAVNAWLRAIFSDRPEVAGEAIRYDCSGYVPRPEFYQWIADRVDWADDWQTVERRFQSEVFEYLEVDQDVADAIRLIAKRYPIGLLTNGDGTFQLKKFAALGVADLFEEHCVFATGDIGHHKPDVRAFQRLIEAFGCAGEEILYVGDNADNDVGGARAAGMQTCWIQLTDEHQCGEHQPHCTLRHVSELPALLGL